MNNKIAQVIQSLESQGLEVSVASIRARLNDDTNLPTIIKALSSYRQHKADNLAIVANDQAFDEQANNDAASSSSDDHYSALMHRLDVLEHKFDSIQFLIQALEQLTKQNQAVQAQLDLMYSMLEQNCDQQKSDAYSFKPCNEELKVEDESKSEQIDNRSEGCDFMIIDPKD